MAGTPRLRPKSRHAAARGTAAHNSAEYCLKPLNAWHVQQLKNATAGNWEKMAFIAHQKQSQNGRWKNQYKALRECPGAHQVLLAGSAVGSWIT